MSFDRIGDNNKQHALFISKRTSTEFNEDNIANEPEQPSIFQRAISAFGRAIANLLQCNQKNVDDVDPTSAERFFPISEPEKPSIFQRIANFFSPKQPEPSIFDDIYMRRR